MGEPIIITQHPAIVPWLEREKDEPEVQAVREAAQTAERMRTLTNDLWHQLRDAIGRRDRALREQSEGKVKDAPGRWMQAVFELETLPANIRDATRAQLLAEMQYLSLVGDAAAAVGRRAWAEMEPLHKQLNALNRSIFIAREGRGTNEERQGKAAPLEAEREQIAPLYRALDERIRLSQEAVNLVGAVGQARYTLSLQPVSDRASSSAHMARAGITQMEAAAQRLASAAYDKALAERAASAEVAMVVSTGAGAEVAAVSSR